MRVLFFVVMSAVQLCYFVEQRIHCVVGGFVSQARSTVQHCKCHVLCGLWGGKVSGGYLSQDLNGVIRRMATEPQGFSLCPHLYLQVFFFHPEQDNSHLSPQKITEHELEVKNATTERPLKQRNQYLPNPVRLH